MLCCNGVRTAESVEIDEQLRHHHKNEKYHLRILMLGTSASGKSTIAKQLKILYKNGFTVDELENYKQILMLNIFNGLKEMVFQVEHTNRKISKKNRRSAKYFVNVNSYTEPLTPENAELAKKLWQDKSMINTLFYIIILILTHQLGIQEVWKNRNTIDFPINLEYMMNNIDRFAEPNYVPTNTDVLFARQRTTGVVETTFKVCFVLNFKNVINIDIK